MRRLLLTTGALVLMLSALAQMETTSTTAKPLKNKFWKTGGSLAIIGGQSGTRNWAPAPEKFSLTGVANLYLWARKTKGSCTWMNTFDFAYGLVNTESQGIRKIEDRIDVFSRMGYSFTKKLGLGVAANLRSQFSDGYDYSEEPRKRISGLFAPAYVYVSPGLQVAPTSYFNFHVGPMARWIIVTNSTLR